MIIKKYLEFKPKQNSLQASYAIVQKKIDTTNIIDNSFLSCEEVRILSQMSNNIRRESFYMGRLAAKKAIGLLRPNSLPSEIDIIPGLLENPVILGIKPINLNISIKLRYLIYMSYLPILYGTGLAKADKLGLNCPPVE